MPQQRLLAGEINFIKILDFPEFKEAKISSAILLNMF
jgi:hypothetical protein